MSFHRTVLVACAAVFATVFSSVAFAQCGGCGGVAVTYVQPIVVQPVVEVQPVVVQPIVQAAPIAVDCWDTNGWGGGGCGRCGGCGGCGGCGCCGGCSSTFGYHAAVGPSPLYVVNQGPEYSGPGLTVPYGSYSPATNLAAPAQYPYVAGPRFGYGPRYPRPYYGSRFAYQRHYWNPYRYYPHRWRG
jgi:hypothetical protein